MTMTGSIFAVLAAVTALPTAGEPAVLAPVLDSLVGKWAITQQSDGKQSSGSETWSAAVPGKMYVEHRDSGEGASRTVGTAAVWQASPTSWRAVWCADGQPICMPLRVELLAGEMVLHADESAPPEVQAFRERFHLSSRDRLEQIFEACSAAEACKAVSTVLGTRR